MAGRRQKVSDDEVFAAAQRAMSRRMPHDLTLADIADEAGVTPGRLVQRFGSKRALFVALSERFAGSAGPVFAGLRTAHRGPLATLRAYAEQLPPGFPCVSKVWQDITVHTWTKVQDRAKAGKQNPHFLDAAWFMESVFEPYRLNFADHAGPFVFEFQAISQDPRDGLPPDAFAARLDAFFSQLPRDAQSSSPP